MSADPLKRFVKRLTDVEREVRSMRAPQLAYSSVEDGAVTVKDQGDTTMIVGLQYDGTHTAAVVAGPTPPTPIVPYVVSQPGTLRVYWDGTFTDGNVAPMDFARVLAYAEPLAEYTGPEPLNQALIIGQFTSATGSELTAALDPGVEYAIYFVCWSQAGKYSIASEVETVTVGSIVDAAEVAAKASVYKQDTPPWPDGEAGHADDVNDLWIDTSLGPGEVYRVISKSATSGVVTLTLEDEHTLLVGQSITVADLGEDLNGTFDITAVGTTSVSYALAIADIAETATPAGRVQGQNVRPVNRVNVWDGSAWILTQDAGASNATTLVDEVWTTQRDLATLAVTATDASRAAYAADGRISISDYEPNDQDVFQLDANGNPLLDSDGRPIAKQDGSMWITRTRDRLNQAVNPSFEVSTAGWTPSGATLTRTSTPGAAGDGTYVGRVVNQAGSHVIKASSPLVAAPGQEWTASGYIKSISGLATGLRITVRFLDASNAPVGSASADFDTTTTDWTRLYVTATAPLLTAKVEYEFQHLAASGDTSSWDLDAVLVEQSGRLGRYFDGDSEGGSWIQPEYPNLSASALDGNAIIRLFTLEDRAWTEKFWTADTIASLNASVIDRGVLLGQFLEDNGVAIDKLYTPDQIASEVIAPGDLVNIWNNNGVHMVRLAKAVPDYRADGFALEAALVGQLVKVYTHGYNPLLSGLAPGSLFLSTAAGKVSSTPPSDVGTMIQRVGHSIDAETLNFAPVAPVALT